ncbi:MAG: MaoC family dehydratase N-terminal domain-containing protein [Rhodocyclaceae bacterium]|jgi:acyl dehydratase|nr:MaoC family dehydratase N-terminal domain-containing protein [Rhodocyclaceae bacterium]
MTTAQAEQQEKAVDLEQEVLKASHAEITDADIERARALVGAYTANREQQYVTTASEDSIRNFAVGYGDDNPLFTDPDYAEQSPWGSQIAPPMMAAVIGKPMLGDPLPEELKQLKKGLFKGIHVFVSGSEWDWYRPIRPGDTLYSFVGEDGVEVKPSEYAGRTVTKFLRTVKVNQNGEVVGVYRKRSILSDRKAAKKKGKYTELKAAVYSDEDLAKIDAVYAQEQPRGAAPRYWEDVQIGDSMGQMAKGPLTVTDIIVFHAGGYGFVPYAPTTGRLAWKNRQRIPGFYIKNSNGVPDVVQRVHWDQELSLQTTGNPLPYDYGVMRECWIHHFLTDWAGDHGWVEHQYDEVRRFNYLGDTQFITGEVVGKRQENGRCLVDVKVTVTSQRDEMTAIGEATIALPSRELGAVSLPDVPQELRETAARMFARHQELLKEKKRRS